MVRNEPPGGDPRSATPLATAAQLLARKPLSEAELRTRLLRRGFTAEQTEATLERLRADGHLDDRQLALHFVITRAGRLGHGRQRLLLDLQRRGIPGEVAERAWERAVVERLIDPLEPLRKAIRRERDRSGGRLAGPAFRRVYNALLRAGFDAETVAAELEPYRPEDPGATANGIDDELC